MPIQTQFDRGLFFRSLADRLVRAFEDAAQAGTPTLIGSARETEARQSIERVLRGSVAIGTGRVCDSYDGISSQQDLIIYERDLCPRFRVSTANDSTIFPCEGVVAVGEIKSTMGDGELIDALTKIASAKRLKRHSPGEPDGLKTGRMLHPYRPMTSAISFEGSPAEDYDQEHKQTDQLFGFILCHRFSVSLRTMLTKITNHILQSNRLYFPNVIVSLEDGAIRPYDFKNHRGQLSFSDANEIAMTTEEPFSLFLRMIEGFIHTSRTVPMAEFHRYYMNGHDSTTKYEVFKIA